MHSPAVTPRHPFLHPFLQPFLHPSYPFRLRVLFVLKSCLTVRRPTTPHFMAYKCVQNTNIKIKNYLKMVLKLLYDQEISINNLNFNFAW